LKIQRIQQQSIELNTKQSFDHGYYQENFHGKNEGITSLMFIEWRVEGSFLK